MAENIVQSALAKVRQTANQILRPVQQATQDTQGFIQQGKFIPTYVQQTPFGQAVKRLAATPVAIPAPLVPVLEFGQRIGQLGAKAGEGVIESASLGLIDVPFPKSTTTAEKTAYGLGAGLGFVVSPVGKALGAIGRGTEAVIGGGLGAVAPQLPKIVSKVAPIVGSEAAQVGTYLGGQALAQQVGLRPTEAITPATFAQQVGLGLGLRGALNIPQASALIKGITPEVKVLSQDAENVLSKDTTTNKNIQRAISAEAKNIEQRLLTQGIEKDLAKTQAQNEARQLVASRVEQLKATTLAMTPTAPQNLLEEAKKFKTPEEFINARLQEEKYLAPDITKFTGDLNRQAIEDWYKTQTGSWENKKIYHGTSEANKLNIENLGFNTAVDKSLYFATNKDITKNYGQNVIDLRKNDFNLLDLRSEEGIKLANKYKLNLEYGDTGSSNIEFKNKVKSLGFDGIEYKTDKTNSDVEIYNIKKANQLLKAKTKQQLTDIWNQAQQSKVRPTQVPPDILNELNQKRWWRTAINEKAQRERGLFLASSYKDAEFYGRPLDQPFKTNVQNPLLGDEEIILKKLGITTKVEPGDAQAQFKLDKQMAEEALKQGYDSIVLFTNKGYKNYLETGKLPRSIEMNDLSTMLEAKPTQTVKQPITLAKVTPPALIAPEPVIGKPPAISPEVPPEVVKVVSKHKVQAKLTIQPKNIDKVIQEGNAQIGRFVEPEKPMRQVLSDSYTMFVDRYNPIVKQAQKAKAFLTKEGAVLRPEFDPEYLVRRLTGAGGIADARFNQELKPIFDQIDSAGIPKIDMDTYLANKRIAGFQKAGRTIYGADPEKAGTIVAALEQKYGQKIKDIANNFYAYQNVGLKELVDSGFLSKDAENILKQANPDYAPLYRVMDQMDKYLGVPSNKTMQGISPIQKIKGSTRLIESPTESIIANTFKQRAAIEKNNVAKAIVGLQNVMDMGFQKVAKASPETITVWNDGKKEFWKVGTEIAETAKSLNEDNVNTFLQILSYPASILRQGATGRNIEFMIPNIIRDQLDAGVTSKYGYVPFVDYTRGLWEVLKNDLNAKFGLSLDDSVYQSWANSGANIDLGQFSGKKSIQQYFDEKTAKRSLMDWISTGLDALGRYSEQPTRIGLYKKALERTGNPLLAMMESRDATIDFARMGTKMKTANSVIPFLNVGVQGFDKLIRSIKNDPAKLAWNMTKYAALPASAFMAYNLLNHKQELAEVPQYVKDNNFVLILGRNEQGVPKWIQIPKGNIIPLIANPIESFMSYLANVDIRSFKELATSLITQTLPIVGDAGNIKESAIKTIGGVIPQAIKPITENLLNVSFYKYNEKKDEAKQIVPDYLKKKPAYQQAYEWTPNLYKSIGAVLNVSPLQVQNLMEGYLAGYTKLPSEVIDVMVKISRNEPVKTKDIPVVRRFITEGVPTPAQQATPTYTPPTPSLMERITGKVGATEKTPEETNVDVIKQKLDYDPKLATPNELAIYYGRDLTFAQTGYKKAIEDKTFYSRLSDIESRETLTPEQKSQAVDILLQKNNVLRSDYEYYKIAKQDTNVKTLYAIDQLNSIAQSGGTANDIFNWFAKNKVQVHGQQVVTSTVLSNLVNDGVISQDQADVIKKMTVSGDTKNVSVQIKAKKIRAKKPRKVTIKKIALKKVKLPKTKVIKLTSIKPVRFARLKQPTTSRVTKLKTIKVRA